MNMAASGTHSAIRSLQQSDQLLGKANIFPVGLARLSEANTPHGSQVNDDDIINKQIQADLNSQAESNWKDSLKKARKRKSRDVDEGSDAEKSPKKSRKEKSRENWKEKRVSKSFRESGLDLSHDSSSNGTEPSPELINSTDRTGKPIPRSAEGPNQDFAETRSAEKLEDGKKKEAEDKIRRDSGLAAVARRTPLGLNREALLQSILKGCSPDKHTDVKAEHALPSESESGNVFATPKVSSTPKTSKGKPRHRVSMVPVLPEGYKPGLLDSKGRFHCPVKGCDKLYTRRATLGEHMNVSKTCHPCHRMLKNAYCV
jgi:hypothetical protein